MSQRIASLYAEIWADTTRMEHALARTKEKLKDFGKATGTITDTGKKSAEASKKIGLMAQAMNYLKKVAIAYVAINMVKKLKDFVIESVQLAAGVETLGVVVDTLGKNAGRASWEMRELEDSVVANGITLQATRMALSRMMQAQIDLSKATDLSRMAQDTAVVSLENSSDSFVRLINVISSGNVRMARQMGIMVSFAGAYKEYADSVGKATGELTEQEKVMIRTNEILEAGVHITGAYEAAMETAGKQALTTARLWEEYQRAIGEQQLGPYAKLIKLVNEEIVRTTQLVRIKEGLRRAREFDLISWHQKNVILAELNRGEKTHAETLLDIDKILSTIDFSPEIEMYHRMVEMGKLRRPYGWLLPQEEEVQVVRDMVTPTKAFFDELNRDIGSPMGDFVKDMEWFIATGGKYETTFASIKQAFLEEKITGEQASAWTEELILSFYDAKEEIGQINLGEAGNKIAEDTSYWWGEAVDMISGTDGVGEAMQSVDTIANEMTGLPGMAGLITQMGIDLGSLSKGWYSIDVVMNILGKYTGVGIGDMGGYDLGGMNWDDYIDMGGLAGGGRLSGLDMVGERGYEIVSNGRVFSHEDSKAMIEAGIVPDKTLGSGGTLSGNTNSFDGGLLSELPTLAGDSNQQQPQQVGTSVYIHSIELNHISSEIDLNMAADIVVEKIRRGI